MPKEITPEVQAILDSLDPDNYDQLGQTEMSQVISLINSYKTSETFSRAQLQETDVALEASYTTLGNISLALNLWAETDLDNHLAQSAIRRADNIDIFKIRIAFFRQFKLKPK